MKTEMVINKNNYSDIKVSYNTHGDLTIQQDRDYVAIETTKQAIQLRDFLIQLNLDKDEN